MKNIISIVGKSDTGKTSFIEKLIPSLKNKGYKLGTIKHHTHDKNLEFDQKGKDTYRHIQAGSDITILSSPTGIGVFKTTNQEKTIDEIVLTYFKDVDIVLTEGYKSSNKPKIEIMRKEISTEPLCTDPKEDNILAYVSDFDFSYKDVPVFNFNDIKSITDLIEEKYLKKEKNDFVNIIIDGKKLPLNNFVQEIFCNTIIGMISTLKHTEMPVKEINIIINPK